MKKDLDKIKDKYGEKFMKFCRSTFPTLDGEGRLYEVISSLFQPNHDLYDDVVAKHLESSLKNYVLSYATPEEEAKRQAAIGDPYELMREAGYTLYKCETHDDVMKFKKFWKNEPIESLCTFRDPHRTDDFDVFFAVKDGATPFTMFSSGGIDGKKREDFTHPLRQDEYGTSVISLQFSKGEMQTISIKNRYNHVVDNPDFTFSNDLEIIHAGLTDAFAKKFGYNFSANTQAAKKFELPNYTTASDGKFYKFNLEVNANYYCPDNVAIIHGTPKTFDKSRYELVENFLIDKVEKTVVDLSGQNDPFCEAFKGYQKMDIKKIENGREFVVTLANGKTAKFTVDKNNQITSYENDSLTEIGDYFLFNNRALTNFSAPNATEIGNEFLYFNRELTEFNAPNLRKVGTNFLCHNKALTELDAPRLTEVGDSFLCYNEKLTKFNAPNLTKVGGSFLGRNNFLADFNAPNLTEAGDYFLSGNRRLTEFNAPQLEKVGDNFLASNTILSQMYIPNLTEVGGKFLNDNLSLTEFDAPSLTEVGYGFLFDNQNLKKFNAPNLRRADNSFLSSNRALTEFSAPNLEEIGDYSLSSNEVLSRFDAPKLKQAGHNFLALNHGLTEFNAPSLEAVGNNFLESNSDICSFNAPQLTTVGHSFLASNKLLTEFNAPQLTFFGRNAFQKNNSMTQFNAPKLTSIGEGCFASNTCMTEFNAPMLSQFDEDVFLNHPERKKLLKTLKKQARRLERER